MADKACKFVEVPMFAFINGKPYKPVNEAKAEKEMQEMIRARLFGGSLPPEALEQQKIENDFRNLQVEILMNRPGLFDESEIDSMMLNQLLGQYEE